MVWVAVGGERECPVEIVDGRGGVKAERPFTGQREEAPRGLLQAWLPDPPAPGRASQLQGGPRSGRPARLPGLPLRSGACDSIQAAAATWRAAREARGSWL